MAAVFHYLGTCLTPRSRLCSSSHLAGSGQLLDVEELSLHHPQHAIPSCRRFLSLASAAKKSRASSKSKVSKSTKSNADLCNELCEFISMTGLPKDSAPSTKVLSEHGRKDLANIVRRRGYKLVTELLKNMAEVDANTEDNFLVNHGACNINGSDSTDGQEKRMEALHEDVSFSSEACHHSSTNEVEPIVFDVQMNDSIGESVNSILHEKASNFVHNGVLEPIEGARSAEEIRKLGGSDVGDEGLSTTGSISVLGHAEAENDMVEATTWGQVTSVLESNGGCAGPNMNAGAVASKQAGLLAEDHKIQRDHSLPSKELNSPGLDQDLSVQASKKKNQAEINLLKEMLQQKELELSQLKQQVEEEKLALSITQSKANAELGNAQKVLLAKDAELLMAEETLSGLKEVEIQYWVDGEVVEIAGSFNGWHQPIKMDRHVSSEAISPKGLRNSILWSTVLWLYPGTYEIKFIVDGDWRIDPQRKFVTRGYIQNNILRVDR